VLWVKPAPPCALGKDTTLEYCSSYLLVEGASNCASRLS